MFAESMTNREFVISEASPFNEENEPRGERMAKTFRALANAVRGLSDRQSFDRDFVWYVNRYGPFIRYLP